MVSDVSRQQFHVHIILFKHARVYHLDSLDRARQGEKYQCAPHCCPRTLSTDMTTHCSTLLPSHFKHKHDHSLLHSHARQSMTIVLECRTTTRNLLIYDEFFVMFLKNVTMTHHLWRFPYFHHGFEVLGSRPKNQWRFINFITIRPTTKWCFNKFVTINKLKITIVFLTYQVYGTKFLYTEIFYKIDITKNIEIATCKIRCIYN